MDSTFENFSLDALNKMNSKQNPSVKKRSTGPVRNQLTGQSTNEDFEIYRSCRENPDLFHLWPELVSLFTTLMGTLFECTNNVRHHVCRRRMG